MWKPANQKRCSLKNACTLRARNNQMGKSKFSLTHKDQTLAALIGRPLTVIEIVRVAELSQSKVSNHLACLHDRRLVLRQQKGRYVHYRLSDERVALMLPLTDAILRGVARGVYKCVRYDAVAEE
jgi:DNA-binding transcriptional ArsR family regulator